MIFSRRSWRPQTIHGFLGLTIALAIAFGMMVTLQLSWTVGRLFLAWLVGVNLSTFAYYGYDKIRAKMNLSRVPEVVLHGLALVGGTLGAVLAMRLFRHKTVKGSFRLLFVLILAIQAVLLVLLALSYLSSLVIPVLVGAIIGAMLVWWSFRGGRGRPDVTTDRSRLAGRETRVQ